MFFDLLIPKLKHLSNVIFHRLPNVNQNLETFLNQVFFLGDFNLSLNDMLLLLKENQSLDLRHLSTPVVLKCKELCQTFSLKKVIQQSSHIASTTSSLLDRMTNVDWKNHKKE